MRKHLPIGLVIIAGIVVIVAFVQFFRWLLPDSLNNEQIVKETKFCEDNGMEAQAIVNGFTYDVTKVICEAKKPAK
jgi:hypothetical protein